MLTRPTTLLAAAVLLTALVPARAEPLPLAPNGAITGLPAPPDNSPVEIARASLTVVLAAAPDAEAADVLTTPVHVRLQIRLKNPTGQPVDLPLTFPVFDAPNAGIAGFRLAQDDRPLANVTAENPALAFARKQVASQKEWLQRLDAWVLERPDVAGPLQRLRAAPPVNGNARDALREALRAHNYTDYRLLDLLTDTGPPESQFAAAVAAIGEFDSRYRVEDANGRHIYILQSQPSRYAAHRDDWIKQTRAVLLSMEDVAALLPAYRAQLAREKQGDAIATLLETKYSLTRSRTILDIYLKHAPRDRIPETAVAPDEELFFQGVGIETTLAAELFPDVARELSERRSAAAQSAAHWGADPRRLSPLTGKLYTPPETETETGVVMSLLTADDATIPEPKPESNGPPAGPMLLRCAVHLDAGAQSTISLEYDTRTAAHDGTWASANPHGSVQQFTCIFAAARFWKSTGPLDVVVSAPANQLVVLSPELPARKAADNRVEYFGTLEKISGNLHLASLPPGPEVAEFFDLFPSTGPFIPQAQAVLAKVTNKDARFALRATLAHVLMRTGCDYDAWELVRAARAQPAAPALLEGALREFVFDNQPTAAQQVWEYIEAKARSPRLVVDNSFEYDPAKNELHRFEVRDDGLSAWPTLNRDDLVHLAARVAAWDMAKGTVEEQLSARFILARADVNRDKNLRALVDLALAQDDSAVYALRLIAALPGDKGPALPLIRKLLPAAPLKGDTPPRAQAAFDALSELGGEPVKVAELAAETKDEWTRLVCLRALGEMEKIPVEAIAAILTLNDAATREDQPHRLYLEILARNDKEGFAALRATVATRSDWSMLAGQHLAERGDFFALDRAVELYNTAPFNPDIWAHDRQELDRAARVLALSKSPGLFKRIHYRNDLPVSYKGQLLERLAGHPEPDAGPFIDAFYQQHVKGNRKIDAGWFAAVLVASGNPAAETMLREMAPHGNMAVACAHALDDLLFPPSR